MQSCKWKHMLGAVALVMSISTGTNSVLADPAPNMFSLDGDAIDPNKGGGPDDWGTDDNCMVTPIPPTFPAPPAYPSPPDSCSSVVGPEMPGEPITDPNKTGGSSFQDVFLMDATGAGDNVHAMGKSKDDLPLRDWKWKIGSVSNKTDIAETFAAAYDDSGNLVIFFGGSLFDSDGDANISYWFFKNQIQTSTGEFICPGVPDDDDCHAVGDILIQANFVNGGTTALIGVFEWLGDGTGNVPPKGNLNEVFSGNATCVDGVAGDDRDKYCAIVNETSTTDAPDSWGHVSMDASDDPSELNTNTDDFSTTTFFEGGIDITLAFPGSDTCFASFIAGSRSSASVRAIREDFALGSFQTCGLNIDATCSNSRFNADFTKVLYDVTGTVTASLGTVFDVEIWDAGTMLNSTADDVMIFDKTDIPALAMVDTNGENWGTDTIERNSTSALSKSYFAKAAPASGAPLTIITDFVTKGCTPPSASPTMSVTKTCRTCLTLDSSMVKVTVQAEGMVCNTAGTGGITLTSVAAMDDAGTAESLCTGNGVPFACCTGSGAGATCEDDDQDVTFNAMTSMSNTFAGSLVGGECVGYSVSYAPSTLATNIPGQANFTDTVTASASTSLGFPVTDATGGDTCPLCPPTGDLGNSITCPALP